MKFALFFYASLARSVAAMALEPLKFFTIVLENAKYNKVLGDPYFSKLASLGQLLTNFHAAIHPSQGNYFAMISGDHHDIGGITGDMTVTLDVKSIVDLLEEGGRSWTTYQQGYPGNCSKVSKFGSYVRKHNPFISIKNIQNNPERCARIVNADRLAIDIANQNVSDYVFYTPDMNNDGHDTSIKYSSIWLQSFLDPLLANPYFKNTLFMITYDENEWLTDVDDNRIYTVLLGRGVTANRTDDTRYSHYSAISFLQKTWGLGSLGSDDDDAVPLALVK